VPGRYTLFGGKGGVGKTTCAAAAAVRAAADGSRVLVVSTDPAHSLADALGVKLGRAPRRVDAADGELFAAELDADRALHAWRAVREGAFRAITERGTYLDDEDVDELLSLTLPGVDELVGLLELRRLASMRAWDEIVVDTAPTGHTLRLLSMPETLRRFAEVLDHMHAKHRFLAMSLGGRYRPDFADDVIAGIERDAVELRAMLTDASRATFTWVTLLEALPLDESVRGVRALEALGVRVANVVANRVWPTPAEPCGPCTSRVAHEEAARAATREAFAGKRLLEIPAAEVEPRGVHALFELASSVRAMSLAPHVGSVASEPRLREPAAGAPLPFPASARLVLFGGKGGVGKTTAAAACALDLAARTRKKRVLLLSTDPAHSLGDALGYDLGDERRAVTGAPANLVVRELDAYGAFERERERYRAAIDDVFSSIFRGRMEAAYDRQVLEDLLDIAPPGIDEIVAVLTIVDALAPDATASPDGETFDVVIVDTAPTGHTLRLLALPPKVVEWVHALMRILLKYRRVIGLGDLASDLTQLARRLRALVELLGDPGRCAFVAVARPAALPRLETTRLVRGLAELGIPVSAVVANAVTTGTCARCRRARLREAPELARLAALGPCFRAPERAPPPSGHAALLAWRAAWSL
jgi:arsenite-transporting ATPase